MRSNRLLLQDIDDAMRDISSFTSEMSREEFIADNKTRAAVSCKLAIIGDASKMTSQEILDKCSDIPWKDMKELRNELIHKWWHEEHPTLMWETVTALRSYRAVIKHLLLEFDTLFPDIECRETQKEKRMTNPTCASCTYFDETRTVCRRYPPTVTAVVMQEDCSVPPNYHHETREAIVTSTNFPEVEADDWCGEWTAVGT